ncbi:DM DNA-binding domain-containing protein [Aphelenchoides bicaudatus]|nr:DM DNA-binding domain-containing protein [Aphelenchoides bicaudatus]
MTESECQRFFALSKRVPKDVKRFCGICRQHGVLLETRGHTCSYKDCNCNKCQLVRTRRQIMSQQIRLRRAQDKRFQRTNEPQKADVVPIKLVNEELASIINATHGPEYARNMCYFCQKCKNHEILVWKKQHKRQCPFTNCTCEKCELIETRRRLDQHMKKRKASLKAAIEAGLSPESLENFTPSPKHSDASTPPVQLHSPLAPAETLKIEDAFLQQKPMFAIPQVQSTTSPIPVSAPLPIFVPALQPTLNLQSLKLDGCAFSPPISIPMMSTADFSIQAPVTLTAPLIQPTTVPSDFFQMIQKTISPPVISAPVSPPIQFLPAVSAPAVNFAPVEIPAMSTVPQVTNLPQISYKELEQFLMLRHQQKLSFQ